MLIGLSFSSFLPFRGCFGQALFSPFFASGFQNGAKGFDSKTVQRSALCRSRRELSNEYLLANFGIDTAENEPCKGCKLSAYRSPRSSWGRCLQCKHYVSGEVHDLEESRAAKSRFRGSNGFVSQWDNLLRCPTAISVQDPAAIFDGCVPFALRMRMHPGHFLRLVLRLRRRLSLCDACP